MLKSNSLLIIIPALTWLPLQLSAQPNFSDPNPPPNSGGYNSQAATVVIIFMGVVFMFVGFLSIFLRHFLYECLRRHDVDHIATYRGGSGLDPDVVKTFPTFLYSDVRKHNINKGAELECAVCLSEFQDTDLLRLLPKCNHVFHSNCIDPWLANRVTCPICRATLEFASPVNITPMRSQPNDVVQSEQRHSRSPSDDEDLITNIRKSPDVGGRPGMRGITRSHSTGHSLVRPGENLERFTLRLPEPVRNELVSLNLPGLVSPRWVYDRSRSVTSLGKGKPGSSRTENNNTSNNNSWSWFLMGSPLTSRMSPAAMGDGGESSRTTTTTPLRNLMMRSPLNRVMRPTAEDTGERSFDRLNRADPSV